VDRESNSKLGLLFTGYIIVDRVHSYINKGTWKCGTMIVREDQSHDFIVLPRYLAGKIEAKITISAIAYLGRQLAELRGTKVNCSPISEPLFLPRYAIS
jgi:hypothetical protein